MHKIYPTLNNTPDHGLSHPFKGPEVVVNGLRGTKFFGEMPVHNQPELNSLRVLSVPTDENLKD